MIADRTWRRVCLTLFDCWAAAILSNELIQLLGRLWRMLKKISESWASMSVDCGLQLLAGTLPFLETVRAKWDHFSPFCLRVCQRSPRHRFALNWIDGQAKMRT